MSIFATPRQGSAGSSDELKKGDLLDTLCVFRIVEYDPETLTKYGTSASVRCHVTVVDGLHAGRVEPRFFAAGNLGKQLGEALDVGAQAPGRIVRGTTGSRDYWGVNWATSAEDLAAAEAALTAPAEAAKPEPVVMRANAEPVADDVIPF